MAPGVCLLSTLTPNEVDLYDTNAAEEYKLAEPGGQLDAFYQEADAMAAELGIPTEDALAMADQALGTKIASDILTSHAAAAMMGGYEDDEGRALAKLAGYLPPSGPQAGVQNYLADQAAAYDQAMMEYEDGAEKMARWSTGRPLHRFYGGPSPGGNKPLDTRTGFERRLDSKYKESEQRYQAQRDAFDRKLEEAKATARRVLAQNEALG